MREVTTHRAFCQKCKRETTHSTTVDTRTTITRCLQCFRARAVATPRKNGRRNT